MKKVIISISFLFLLVGTILAYTPQPYDSVDLVLGGSYTPQPYDSVDLVYGATTTDSCSCPGLNTNWEINLEDYCIINSDCNIGTGNISWINNGNATFNAKINSKNMEVLPNNGILFIDSNTDLILG